MHHQFAERWQGRWHGRHDCIGRHGHRHGFGALAGGFGEAGIGWQGFRAGRKLGAEHLQLLILALLAEKPAHGYEIIKALGERSGGFYTPSPGMVYPALTYLEEIGYASVEAEGTKKLYSITDAGRAHLDANRGTADTLLAQLRWVGEKMEHVRDAFNQARDDAEAQPTGPLFGARRRRWMSRELHQAGAALKAVLFDKRDAPEDEQQRIADVLRRAAEEIRRR
jgi:DNA-binding PadR family transcriptional regulator